MIPDANRSNGSSLCSQDTDIAVRTGAIPEGAADDEAAADGLLFLDFCIDEVPVA